MAYTVEEVVKRHRELTAEIAVISQRHAQELAPYQEGVKNIEAWILAKMNQEGVDSYKTAFGTAYQSRLRSIKQDDPIEFRNYVLRPAALSIIDAVSVMGGRVTDREAEAEGVLNLISKLSLWDLADFRPGKKGILKYQEDTNQQVPGVSLTEIVNVNVRGS